MLEHHPWVRKEEPEPASQAALCCWTGPNRFSDPGMHPASVPLLRTSWTVSVVRHRTTHEPFSVGRLQTDRQKTTPLFWSSGGVSTVWSCWGQPSVIDRTPTNHSRRLGTVIRIDLFQPITAGDWGRSSVSDKIPSNHNSIRDGLLWLTGFQPITAGWWGQSSVIDRIPTNHSKQKVKQFRCPERC